MTLIEVLVALTVMTILFGVAYDTIHQSLRFHEHLQRDSQRIEDSSQLAERLTGDFAALSQFSNTAPAAFLLKLRNNSTIEYHLTTNAIIRIISANGKEAQRQYHVGKTSLTFWSEQTHTWSPRLGGLPTTNTTEIVPWDREPPTEKQPPVTVRLQFADSELIVSQEKR